MRRRFESGILKMAGSVGRVLTDISSRFRLSWNGGDERRTSMMGSRALDWPVESS